MAGASTAGGAQADAAAKANTSESANVEHSDAGVSSDAAGDVTVGETRTVDNFEEVTLYGHDGTERVANSLERFYALKHDGFSERKPESADEKKTRKSRS